MSRLTERDEFGNADVIGANSESWMPYLEYDELNAMTDALNKLAKYEDAEEAAEHSATGAESAASGPPTLWPDGNKPLPLDTLMQLAGDPVWCGGTACFWALCWNGKLLMPSGERVSAKACLKTGIVFYRSKLEQS